MKFNTKIRYGIRVMIELSLNSGDGILQKEIARSQGISLKYLDHIIPPLKIALLIKTFKGKGSGYVLSKPLEDITLLEIFKAFDPQLVSIDCLDDDDTVCGRGNSCAARDFWLDLNHAMEGHLTSVKLYELAEKEKGYREKGKSVINFSI